MAEQIVMRMEGGGCSLCAAPQRTGSTSITASVGRGGRNLADDVRAVQSALNAQDVADGGPGVKLAVDGLVGPLTIAAIEHYQRHHFGWADGRVDPDGPTIHALNGDGGGGASAAQKGGAKPPSFPKATPAQNKAFIEKVGGLLPRARHWVEMAQLKLDMASDFVSRGPVNPKDPFPALHDIGKPDLALFNKYFHSDKQPRAAQLRQLQLVRHVYDLMQTVLTESLLQAPMFGWGVGYFQPDPADGTLASQGYVAYTFFGGWQRRRPDGRPRLSGEDNYAGAKDLRQDTIFFPVAKLLSKSDNYLLETIIHELAHFVGPGGPLNGERIGDYTYDTKADFLTVSNWTALHTAETFGYFAAEAALHKVTIPII
jgi:peptidoglycan hydrolase-like protein with peptidoglycan-binding domain